MSAHPNSTRGIVAEQVDGMTILRSATVKPYRRVLYLNSYGMAKHWREVAAGLTPGQHLWGCIELAQMGYEVAMPEEPDTKARFYNYRRQDRPYLSFARSWLGREGIVYSAHTVLFWLPLLRQLALLRSPIVTLFYARDEKLRFTSSYQGVLAMTRASEDRARQVAPRAKIARIGWGVDLPYFPPNDYRPQWFLSCGKTRRDFATLATAATEISSPIHIVNTQLPPGLKWPENVKPFTGGRNGDWLTLSFSELIRDQYSGCTAALILIQEDSIERFAAGFTQLLEAMALARPVILTRTGAVPSEIDVEKEGIGLFVPPNDPAALVRAMKQISDNPARAAAMGRAGRQLCERYYDIQRYAQDLHTFFESL